MDNAQNNAAKETKGNLTDNNLPQNVKQNDVTKIKTSDHRKPTNTGDLDAQKRQLKEQGRGNKV
jgi:hypothetical protein